jgi:hypothetical protein
VSYVLLAETLLPPLHTYPDAEVSYVLLVEILQSLQDLLHAPGSRILHQVVS